MSISTLILYDKARSGCKLKFVQAKLSDDGVYHHPFHFHDNYWRPDSLPEDLEQATIASAAKLVDILDLSHMRSVEVIRGAVEEYYHLLTNCLQVVSDNPPQDFFEVFENEVNTCRVECLYNLAILTFNAGASRYAVYGNSVETLENAAALFDEILTASWRPDSERMELSPANLRVMATVAMGTAYEIAYLYHLKDCYHRVAMVADLAHHASFYFTVAAAVARDAVAIPDREGLLNFVNIKREYYAACKFFVMSLELNTTKGESRRARSKQCFEGALQHTLRLLPGERKNVETEITWGIERCVNFKKLSKKGLIPEASFSAEPKRSAEFAESYPFDVNPRLATEVSAYLTVPDEEDEEGEKSMQSKNEKQNNGGSNSSSFENDDDNLQLLSVETHVESTDLRTKPNLATLTDTSVRYHFLRSAISVTAPKESPKELTSVAMVFLVDINHPEPKIKETLKDVISLAIRTGRFSEKDQIACVQFDSDGIGKVNLVPATTEHIEKSVSMMMKQKGRGRFEGSKGTRLFDAVLSAQKALREELPENMPKEIMVISDGWDNSAFSDKENWELYCEHRHKEGVFHRSIPIHCFAVSSAADHPLLTQLCKMTAGNYGAWREFDTNDSGEGGSEGTNIFRRWMVSQICNAKIRVATQVTVDFTCTKKVMVAQVSHEKHEINLPTASTNFSPSKSIDMPDFSSGNQSHVVFTLAIPSDICKHDLVSLGVFTVRYNAVQKQQRSSSWTITKKYPVKNISTARLADLDAFGWLSQLTVEQLVPSVRINAPGDSMGFYARGGETVCNRNTVSTGPHGSLVLSTIEGSNIEMDGNTECTFTDVTSSKISFTMQEGKLNLVTNQQGYLTCVCGKYTVSVPPNAAVRLSYKDGIFSANSILGYADISTVGAAEPLKLDAPKQTSARSPQAPVIPWAITEDIFDEWIAMENQTSFRLRQITAIHTQLCRGFCSQAIALATRYLGRALRKGTLQQNRANSFGRVFVMNHVLTEAKQFMINSVAYAITNPTLDSVRHEMQRVMGFAAPKNRYSIKPHEITISTDISRATAKERPQGCCMLFELPQYHAQLQALLNERERLLLEAAMAREAEMREAVDAEARRRRELISPVFSLWDFRGTNALGTQEIQTVLYSMPTHESSTIPFVSKWEQFVEAVGKKRYYEVAQFVAIACFLGEDLQPFDFNAVCDEMQKCVISTARDIDQNRLSRALYCTFCTLDREMNGYVSWSNIISAINHSFGENVQTFRRVEVLTTAAIAAIQELGCGGTQEINVSSIETCRITASVYLKGMKAFFDDLREGDQHLRIEVLYKYLKTYIYKYPQDIKFVMLRERKEKEKVHLKTWDLKHVFDGISRKQLQIVVSPDWKAPEFIQEIAGPVAYLAGLSKRSNEPHDGVMSFTGKEDHWSNIRNFLRRDSANFFKFLETFPVLSISHKQAQRVSECLRNPQLDASNMLKIAGGEVLGVLLSWVRLLLRIAFLEHDFEVPVPTEEAVVSRAIAEQCNMTPLMRVTPLPPAATPVPTPNIQKIRSNFSYYFQNVFEKAPILGHGSLTPFASISTETNPNLSQYRQRKELRAFSEHNEEFVSGMPRLHPVEVQLPPQRPSTARAAHSKRNFQFKRPDSARTSRESASASAAVSPIPTLNATGNTPTPQ